MTKVKLSKAEIRRRQSAAGKKRRGPQKEAEGDERVSVSGYVVPGRYTGTRHLARNVRIIEDFEGGQSVKALATTYNLSPKTIEHIIRYQTKPTRKE